jgi:hypothetical protein
MTGRLVGVITASVVVFAAMAVADTSAVAVPSARLEFRPVLAVLPAAGAATTTMAPADRISAAVTVATCDAGAVEQLAVIPTTRWRASSPHDCVVYAGSPGGPDAERYYLGPAGPTSATVRRARAQFVTGQGWTVKLDLTRAGAEAWDALAQQQFHAQVAISVDGIVQAAPTIQPNDETFTSFGGVAVFSGNFTRKGAERVAVVARPTKRR